MTMRIGLTTSVGVTLDAFFSDIIHAWERSGNAVFPIAGTRARSVQSDIAPSLSRRPALRNFKALNQLRRWSVDRQLDIVLTNTATASALTRAAGLTCPVVYFCHGLHWNEPSVANWPTRAIERRLLQRTAGIVTINSSDEAWFRNSAPAKPLLRLRAGVGLDLASFQRTPTPVGSKDLLWVGEFTDRKRPHEALKVLANLRNSGADVGLVMLGEGPLFGSTLKLRDRLGLMDAVQMLGYRPVEPLLRRAAGILHTARWEGLPRVLLEAIAVGRPVFAYDVKGVRDVPGAFLTSDADPIALATLIGKFLRGEGGAFEPMDPAWLSYNSVAQQLERFMYSVCSPGTGDLGGGC
jgi:glycosyltransferase involved in cell wall biosynthesis